MKRRMKIPMQHMTNEDLSIICFRIMAKSRASQAQPEDEILIPESPVPLWSRGNPYHKATIVHKYSGEFPVMGKGKDESCMLRFLANSKVSGFQDAKLDSLANLLPAGAPLLDFLSVHMQQVDDWKLPSQGQLEDFRKDRGLSMGMLNQVEVREIVVGSTDEKEIKDTLGWFWEKYYEDQSTFPTNTVSMDVEQHQSTLYETFRMAGRLKFKAGRLMSCKLEKTIDGEPEDRPQQIPVKIMIGNGIRYALMISLNVRRDIKGRFLVSKITVPDSVVDFISSVPVCTGVNVKHDIEDVEYL